MSRIELVERMTAEQFFQFAPDDQKAELIDGVLRMAPPPLDSHERVQTFLLRLIAEFVEINDLGEVRGSRTAVRLDEYQTYEPDVLFISRPRTNIIEERGVFGAPDLVVEVLSASTAAYDRGAKFKVYEQAGVQELWLIDPYGPVGTEYFQREGNRLRPVMPDSSGILSSTTLPGFKLTTTWLWPDGQFVPIRQALQKMGSG
jgi:Uma2 family endonuclease